MKCLISLLLVPFLATSYGQDIQSSQKKETFDSIISSIKQQSSSALDFQIKIHNRLESFTKSSEKLKFLSAFKNFKTSNNHKIDIVYKTFLEGEVLFSDNKVYQAEKKYRTVWSKSLDNDDFNGLLLGAIGLLTIHERLGNKDSINFYSNYGKKIFTKSNNSFSKAFYLRRLGSLEIKNEKYHDAINHLLIVVDHPNLNNSCLKSLALANIGWIYEHLNYPEKAKIYYSRAKKVSLSINIQTFINFNALKLAHIELFNLENPKDALDSYKNLENFYSGTGKYQEGIIYGTIGFAYLKMGDNSNAIKNILKSRDFFEKSKDSSFLCLPYTYLSHYYAETKQFTKAIESGEKAISIINKQKLFEARKLLPLEALAISYKAIYDNENAYLRLNELNTIKTKLERQKNNVSFLESQNELSESLERLKVAQLKNELFKKNKIIYISILSILLVSLLLTGNLYFGRKKHNSQLKKINSLKSNFFANISHEFRTPLTLISSPILETLEERDLTPEKRSHFEMASRNTERLLSLVDQLLDLSKIDSGNRTLHLEKGKITQLVSAWIESFSYLAQQKAISFDVDIKDKEVEVWFDKDALEKIVVNLLGNAIKYTPTKGQIIVKAFIENKLLQLSVKNTGQGLTKDETKNIFNRFYQTNQQNEGTGIGLSLVKELTALHGGTISVKSIKDNWTRFDVSICIDKTRFKNARLKKPSATRQKPPSLVLNQNAANESEPLIENGMPILLIVEDNADVRVLLSDTFKSDFQVITAKNGAEGIVLALKHIPDLIISDVMMPVKDGVELTKTLKNDERSSHIPIVLLTAKAGDENQLKGLNVGADDYITKPFNKKLLFSKVSGLIMLRKKLQLRYSQEVILKPKDIAITSVDERFLEKVQHVLDEKLVESGFNSEAFSKAVHMSRMQLHRKLKALTGLSTSEFIRSQRLKLATHLLKKSRINISEVGYAVGFNDHAYFTKCFRETYNCTPSEFIKKAS